MRAEQSRSLGRGDFNAVEKDQLGWLIGPTRATATGPYEIGPIEGRTTLSQALVVRTATSEFWFESRGRPTPSFEGEATHPPGVAVIAGPLEGSPASPYPRGNVLLRNPSGASRFSFTTNETFTQRDTFRVTVRDHAPERATLEFEWLDRTAPVAPTLRAQALGGRRVTLSWNRPRERESGIATYTVLADDRVVRVVPPDVAEFQRGAVLRLTRGLHRVAVFATDRAGNRGPTTTVRVRVR